jgi:hypothetical protein
MGRVGEVCGGGEARVVIVDAGVDGTKEDSGLVTNPPPSSLIVVTFVDDDEFAKSLTDLQSDRR